MDITSLFKNNKIPLITGRNLVLFPKITFTMDLKKDAEIENVKLAMKSDKMIVFVAQKNNTNKFQRKDIFDIGVLCKILSFKGNENSNYQVTVEVLQRVKITDFFAGKNNLVKIQKIDLIKEDSAKIQILINSLKESLFEFYQTVNFDIMTMMHIDGITDPETLCDFICMANFFDFKERQSLLEEVLLSSRIEKLIRNINDFLQKEKIKREISQKINMKFSKAQREEYLRQQMEEIKKELGSSDEKGDKNLYVKKIEKFKIDEEFKKNLLLEAARLEQVPSNSSEYNVIKTYLDFIIAMPWNTSTQDKISLDEVKKRLDDDHYGLEDVKKRIIEFLAIYELTKGKIKNPIICLVGPPGTGKTSLAISIAHAMGRKFSRTSLGGVKDESEIRGHRRTYVAAMPGKIIQSIKRAESNNPVILLDEIDKMSNSFNGDPASALLEVLDPEQNISFMDHYLDVPFDLSKTLFICTANNIDNIPDPLRDRLEVIEVSSYTLKEKYHIAKDHLIPTLVKEHGLPASSVVFDDIAINQIINLYTRESGVRTLKRQLASICREVVIQWIQKKSKIKVNLAFLEKVLGPPYFSKDVIIKEMEPGIANGLAWTPYGGELLFVETAILPKGGGGIKITGQIGSVMKESSMLALSYIEANSESFGLNVATLKSQDYHFHIPAGAIKKDGPSAGLALFASLMSIVLKKPLPSDVAMTGEITLKGRVLPVGGLKQKVIAAHHAGIKRVILSADNEKDILKEVPEDIRKNMQFVYFRNLAEVYSYLFKA